MENRTLMCPYLDHLDGQPELAPTTGESEWEWRRLDALASSLMDGLSVWAVKSYAPKTSNLLGSSATKRLAPIE